MASLNIRPGTADDLLACTAVWRSTMDPPVAPPVVGHELYRHEAATGTLLVAELDGQVRGFGGTITRGQRWFLADLFVSPDVHGEGIGRRLLDALVERDQPGPIRATMASNDPRALTLYTQLGMTPRWPSFDLAVPADRLRPIAAEAQPAGTVATSVVAPEDLVELASLCSVSLATVDLEYWERTKSTTCFRVSLNGDEIGGGLVTWSTPAAVHDPTAVTIGPLFALRPQHMLATVTAVVNAVRSDVGERTLRCYVPGPNPTFRPLLDAGFRVQDFDLFCGSTADIVDPATMLPSHDLL